MGVTDSEASYNPDLQYRMVQFSFCFPVSPSSPMCLSPIAHPPCLSLLKRTQRGYEDLRCNIVCSSFHFASRFRLHLLCLSPTAIKLASCAVPFFPKTTLFLLGFPTSRFSHSALMCLCLCFPFVRPFFRIRLSVAQFYISHPLVSDGQWAW